MTDQERAQILYDEWLTKLNTVATGNAAMRVWKAARTDALSGTVINRAAPFMTLLHAIGKCSVAYHRFAEIHKATGSKAS